MSTIAAASAAGGVPATDPNMDRITQLGPLGYGDALVGKTCLFCYRSLLVGELAGLVPWCGMASTDAPWTPILYGPAHWACIPEGIRAD
jgi:hypothetical protein